MLVAGSFAALLVGTVLGWLWRGAEIGRLRGDARDLEGRLRELDIEQASRLSERDQILARVQELAARVDALQAERDSLAIENAALGARAVAEQEKHAEQLALLEKNREQLRIEFEHLAHRIFEERGRQFSSQNQQSIEALLKPFGEQIQQFQTRVNEIHSQSIRGNETLTGELRNLLGIGLRMSDQAESLARALKGDKKTTGNWGEVQLERTLQLAGLERGSHYEAQAAFHDGEGRLRMPDFVIKLPDGKHLVIDSKVSLVDYDRAVAAETEEAREEALRAHVLALKRHIDDLAGKDYAGLPGMESPELVFMFMPIEAAYIEALKYSRELFNEGYRKNVVMVSHTTLLPMLRTVASLWIAYRSNEEAREISTMAGEIYNKVCLVGQRLDDLGKTLNTANDKFNRTVTALVGKQGLYGKVERLRGAAVGIKAELPQPTTGRVMLEHERLAMLEEGSSTAVAAEGSQDLAGTDTEERG